ncbi:hypothetical protein [Massilia sp. PWRC2]|uniref:hypothetical protein n=1 Tax=Massilia sp. PWRC2 TaxID=2804626 RepID=UPI003CEC69F0
MPIDTSIYNALLQKPKSVQEYDNEAQTAQSNRLTLQMSQAKMGEYQRGIAQENTLADAYRNSVGADGSMDRNKLYTTVASSGLGAKLPGIQKGFADTDKAQGEIAKQKVELLDAKLKQSRAMLDSVTTPEQYLAWHEANHKDPILGPELASRGITAEQARASIIQGTSTPEGFRTMLQKSALGIEEYTKQNKPSVHVQNLGGTSQVMSTPGLGGAPTMLSSSAITQSADSKASNARAAADSAASRAQSDSHFNIAEKRANDQAAAGKVPAGYRANADGSMSFIPGGPADPAAGGGKAPTEFQGKSAAFGARAEQADKLITGLTGKYSPSRVNAKMTAEDMPLIGGIAGSMANGLMSSSEQQAEQAQRDFVNAVLRQESGAAIGASEFDNAKKQYFPQPNDGPEVIAQKAANRKLAIKGFQNNAGKAAFSADKPAVAALPSGWSVEVH